MNRIENPDFDPRSSVTPDVIDLKFGTRYYVVGATQHAKTYYNRHGRGHVTPKFLGYPLMSRELVKLRM